MIYKLPLRRNWKRLRSSKRRADLLKRLRIGEQLEVRAAPGSMLVDVLACGGHPVAMAQRAYEAAQESRDLTADSERASAKRATHVGQPQRTRDADEPRESVANIARAERPTRPAESAYYAAIGHDPRVGARETPPDTQTDKRSGRALADAWSSDASILVGTGLDDGLDAFGIETPRRSVSDDSGARRTPSPSNSDASAGQLPNLPEGSGLGLDNRTRDVSLFSHNSRSDSFDGRSTSVPSVSQMKAAGLPVGLNSSLSFVDATPATRSATVSSVSTNQAEGFPAPVASVLAGTHPLQTIDLGFASGLAAWNVQETGGSAAGKGTVTAGSAVLREGDSFLVTLDQSLVIPQAPLSLSFTYEAFFDTADPDSINDAFEAVLMAADATPLVYNFAPDRDAYFNLTEQMPSALGTGTTEETVAEGKRVSTDISQIPPGTNATLMFRLLNNDADVDTTIHILSVQLTSGDDTSPVVNVGLTNDTAPDGPGTEAFRTDLLTNDPRIQGTATDDHAITLLQVQLDNGPLVDITSALADGQYSFDPGNLTPGSHRMVVHATDSLLQTAESTLDFVVNTPPVAATGGDRTASEGDTIVFDGSGSTDADGALFRYVWRFHDGDSVSTVGASRSYPQNGTFPVNLTVTDTAGSLASDQIQVMVSNIAPTVLTATDLTGGVGAKLDFAATFSDLGILDLHTAIVDWGDGATSEAIVTESQGQGTVAASHAYAAGGTYTIRVAVTDDAGDSSDRLATAIIVGGQTSSLAGYVYLDVNNNGIKDPPERALPNVPVTLSGTVSWTVTTAADGSYRFADLQAGQYAVTAAQPLAFLDGRETPGTPRMGSVRDNQFYGIELPAGIDATNYNFGELGLRPELIGKYLYLASTPTAEELIARMMVAGGRWFAFQASDTGLLTATIPTAIDAPVIEVYTQGMMPVTLSEGEHALSVTVEEGAAYVLYVAGGASSAEFETTLQLDISDPPTPLPHPRYYTNLTNALDTTGDSSVSARDALVVINALNRGGQVNADAGLLYLDVTGDESLSPRDALWVINYLNRGDAPEGEFSGDAPLVAPENHEAEVYQQTGTKYHVVDAMSGSTFRDVERTTWSAGDHLASSDFTLATINNAPEGLEESPILIVTYPVGETTLPAGQTLVLTGQAIDGNGVASTVRVNGQSVQVLDDAGNFFEQVLVAPGTNTFLVEAADAAGDTTSHTVTISGTQLSVGAVDFTQLSVASGSSLGLYGRTSWHDATSVLYADFGIENIGQYTVDGPVLVGVTNISDPSVRLREATATTPDGIPYFDMSSLVPGGSLQPGEASGLQTISFFAPARERFTYDLVFFAAVNQAPRITTVPDVEALSGHSYVYDVDATDPDGDALTFSLASAPDGMAVDAKTGRISWSPTGADVGTHTVVVQVSDGRGGLTEQRYVLSAIEPPPNRPPLFTSIPVVDASVNVPYSYQGSAADPDDDTLSFSLISGPAGLSISTAGLVTWTPAGTQMGTHSVVLQVEDGRGGRTAQAYAIGVGQEPGNHAPLIVSDPVTQFNFLGPSNPPTGDVNPALLNLDLGLDESATTTVSLTLPAPPPVTPPPKQTFPLTLGRAISGTITVPFAEDNYTFTLAAPSRLYFDSLTNNSGLVWTLVGPAGTAVNNRPFNSSENSNPMLNLAAGNYTLTVVGSDEATGTYQFRLWDLASPLVPVLSVGTPQGGTLDPASETDLFSFTALAGDRFFFDVQARTGADNARWRLVDPYGNILFNQSLTTDVDTTTLAQAGAYTLLLEGSIADTVIGSYTINVQPVTTVSQVLTLGNVVNGSIEVTGEQDQYTFNLAAPALLYFDAITNNAFLRWTLAGPAGTPVNNQTFTSGSDRLSNLPAGDYTLTVDGTGDATGTYQFRFSDLASPLVPALSVGTSQSGTLSPGNETDFYRLSAAAGDKFFFDAQASSGGNAGWRLVDPFGNVLFNTTFGNDVTFTLAQPGSYTLLLEGASGNTGSVSYTFNVQPQGNVPPPPLTGTPLTLGATLSDSIAVAGEQDRYLFTLAAPSLLYFDALTNNSNLNWTLLGPAGTAISNRQFTASDGANLFGGNPVLNVVAGTYQLTVAASGGTTGSYEFRLWDLAQASPLAPGTPLSDQLNPGNETDLYHFTAAAGDRFFFDVQARTGASSAIWRLVDPFGNSLFNSRFDSDLDVKTLAQAGSYTLLLEGHVAETGTGTYTFNAQPVTTDIPALTVGSLMSGSIGVMGEQDQYTFSLAEAGLFYFDSLTNSSSLNWTLVGPAGTAVTSRTFFSSDGASFTGNPVLNLVAGAYTLTVDAAGDLTGAYQFRLLDLADATPLTPGTPVSGALEPANETDLVRFTASAGDRFFFDVTARTGGSQSTWRLVDPYGNILFNTSLATTSSSSDVDTMTLAQAGSYTLLLEGAITVTATDTYTINVQPVANPTAQAFTVGSPVNGSIALPGEQDQYTFSLTAPALAYFDALTNQANLTWTLTGPARVPVNSRRFDASDERFLTGNPVLDLAAGAYTITVDGSGDFTGAYEFRLLNLAEAVSLTPGTPVSGTLDPANETDLFQFTAAAGDKFFFDVQARSGATPGSWRLVDPLGTILFNKGFNDTGTFSDVDTLTLTQAGQYALLLEGAITNPGTSTYRINVQPVTFVSQALTLGSLVSGSIGVPGEQDLYTFSLAAPALLYFDARTSNGTATLIGPAGAAMDNLGFTASFPALNLVAGDYTLTIDFSGDVTGPYQIRLSDLSQAISLTPGTPQSGTLDAANETDLYQFTAAAGDQFFFDVQARTGASRAGWRLVDPYGNSLFNTSFNSDVNTLTLAQPGSYTLLLEGFIFDTGSGSYTFNVQPMGNDPLPPLTGTPLTLGTTTSDSITVAGEEDRYLFTLAEPSLLYFDSLTNNSNLNWTLVGPAGTAVTNRSFFRSDGLNLSGNPVLNLVAGTYQLTVTASGSATGAYQFRLWDLAGRVGAAPSPLTPGTPVSGELNPANETDLYTFSVATPGRFATDFLNRATGINLRLIDPYGNLVSGDLGPVGNPDRQALNLERPGTYTLLVEGGIVNSGTGTYALSVQETPPVFSPGDVFVSTFGKKIERYDQDLNLLDLLDPQIGAQTTGMAFDSSNNLNVTNFTLANVIRFDPSGTVTFPNPFASGDPGSSTESIVFDAAGNFYVGQADGTGDILKFSPDGHLLDRFDVLRDDRGSDWIELAADQTTMFYTSEGRDVLRYDLNTHTQLPRFAKLPGSHAYALRILPDNSVLVADSDRVVRLDQSGQVVQTYTAPGVLTFFALNLDPDGTSFWSASSSSTSLPDPILNNVYKFDISSGSILKSRHFRDVSSLSGIAVLGETPAGTSRIDVVADDPALIFANLSGPVPGIPGQPSTFQAQFTGDGEPHRFDLLFVRTDTGNFLGSLPVRINTFYFYPVQAVDPDGDHLTYSLPIAPAGVTIAADTGRITFDPPAEGDYMFRVQVDDGRGGQALQDYTVHVRVDDSNEAPVITSTAPTHAETGKTFGYAVTASDPDQDLLSFYLTTAPAGMSIDRTTGLVIWEPTAAQVGQQSATVLVLDGHGGRTTQSLDVSVALFIDNQPPRIGTLPLTSATAGELYRYQAAATDPDNDALFFDLVVKPDGMAIDLGTGLVFWQPEPDQVGTQDVILRVQDPRGGVDLQAFQVLVDRANTAPVIAGAPSNSAVADLPYAYQVAAQDADGDPLSYQLSTLPAGMVIDPITGLLSWTPTSTQLGSQAVSIVVSDGHGGQATQSFQVTVLATAPNHPPVFTSTPRTSIRLGSGYLYAVTASDPDGDPLTFHLDQAPARMAISAAGLITWTPEADQFGANAVTARVDDGRGGSATQDFTINVLAQGSNGSPSILSRPPLNTVVGRLYRYDARAEDPDGDPFTWFLEVAPAGMSVDPFQGTLRWTPTVADLGPQQVELRVFDAQGGLASQRFTIDVRGVNSPPVITSTPPTQAAAAQPYGYVVAASDVDDDPLSFALTSGPEGMTIDPSTGLIQWTPDISQLGQQQVEVHVQDGQGGAADQGYTVVVNNTFLNRAPRITSRSVLAAIVNQPYQYQVTALDADGDPLRFDVPRGPTGLAIDPATGLVQWTPNAGQVGGQSVVVTAADPAGNLGFQSYTLRVRAANRSPVITSAPVTVAEPGVLYHYDLLASDLDGDPLSYTLVAGPPGMAMDGLGRVTWVPGLADIGVRHVSLRVADEFGAAATQDYDIQVNPDSQAPKVSVLLAANPTHLGEPVPVLVLATDNVGVQRLTLTANGIPVPLDSGGSGTLSADQPGPVTLVATAGDAAGNTGTTQETLLVIDPFDADAPVVELTSPDEDAVIFAPTDVRGTVTDDNLLFYTLSVAPLGSAQFVEFARGTTNVTDGTLGAFDPSLLQNDSYVLRLEATDAGGNVAAVEHEIQVAGDLKLGNFTLSFTDLTVPVFGVPITVTRTYDTFTATESRDVGFGWRLEFRNMNLRTSVTPTGFEEYGIFNPLKVGSRVYVTVPGGGTRQAFTFQPQVAAGFRGSFLGIFEPRFVPDPGVKSSLTVTPADLRINADGRVFDYATGIAYNPASGAFGRSYLLTTKEGIAYDIDGQTGQLTALSDPNDNVLRFTDGGISGPEDITVAFERDPQGRISAVVDPAGEQIRYGYDAQGDLVAVTDRTGNTTHFEYRTTPVHYLEQVIDPLGRTGVRTEYDAQGRLIKLLDGAGNPVQLAYDPSHLVSSVTDALGNTTTEEYDERGNILRQIDALGGITTRTFDADNNKLTETDPLGRTTAFTYNDRGDALTRTDPLGNTTISTYEAFTFGTTAFAATRGEAAAPFTCLRTATDPLGNTQRLTYDGSGNTTTISDPSGNVTIVGYDDPSRPPISVTDANGNITHFETVNGLLTRQVDALGHATAFTYDANGNQLTSTTTQTMADGSVRTLATRTEYDAEGRAVAFTDAEGGISRTEYDAVGNTAASIDRLGRRSEYRYDHQNKLVETVLPDDTPADLSDNPRTRMEYDALGRKTANIDELGQRTEYQYDALGRLTRTISADGTFTQTQYDAAGEATVLIDERGNRTELEYDAKGLETVRRDPFGNAMVTTYDAAGRSQTVTNPLGDTKTFVHDAAGRIIETENPDGTKSQVTFDGRGQVVARTDPLGRTTRYEYDALGRVMAVIDAFGHATTFTYDENGNPLTTTTTVTAANGTVRTLTTRNVYDGLGRVVAATDAEGGVARTEYDAADNPTATIDQLGRRTEYHYDAQNRLIEIIYPDATPGDLSDNPRTKSEYDAAGQEIARINELGRRTEYRYDPQGRLVKTIYPDGAATQAEYNTAGLVSAQIDERGNRTEFQYDENQRVIGRRDALGNSTSYAYDDGGRRIADTDALGHTTQYVYDALHRLIRTDYADGTSIFSSYDASGREIARTDQLGRTTRYEYDALGRTTAVVDPLNQRTEYTYDETSSLVGQKDASGHVTRYEYDGLARRTATVLPLGERSQTTYDAVGNVTVTTDFNGAAITFQYDTRDRLVSKSFPDSTSLTYTYTPTSQLSTVTDSRGITSYIYDSRDRLLSRTDPDGAQVSYTYDLAGNRTSLSGTVAGASLTKTYTFDTLNRLETVIDPDQGVTRYTYDAVGNVLRTELPNAIVETRSYDDLNRLLSLENRDPSGVITSHRYTLAPNGRRDTVIEQDGRRVDYTYDALDRLIREAITDAVFGDRTFDYAYDAVGNRLTRNDSAEGLTQYTYDANDRLLTEISGGALTEYTYDDNGNMLSRTSATDRVFYNWDFENRLVAADTDGDGTIDVRNMYDDDAIRVSQTVAGQETRFLIDAALPLAQVLLEYRPSGLIIASYVYGNGLISQSRGGARSFYHVDGLGSTRALTDAAGAVLNRYLYDAFGRMLNQTGTASNSYLFAGQQRDSALGLDYLRARYYDPTLGRFVSADPLGGLFTDPNRFHVYSYGSNDPANQIDPSGMSFIVNLGVTVAISSILGAIHGAVNTGTLQGTLQGAKTGFLFGLAVGLTYGGVAWAAAPEVAGGTLLSEAVVGESILANLPALTLITSAGGVAQGVYEGDAGLAVTSMLGLLLWGATDGRDWWKSKNSSGGGTVSNAASETDQKLTQVIADSAAKDFDLQGTALGSQAENVTALYEMRPAASVRNETIQTGLTAKNVVTHLKLLMPAPRKVIVLTRSQTEAPGVLDYIEAEAKFQSSDALKLYQPGPSGVVEIWARDGNGLLELVRIFAQYPEGPFPPGSPFGPGPPLNPPAPTGPPPVNPLGSTVPAEGQTAPGTGG